MTRLLYPGLAAALTLALSGAGCDEAETPLVSAPPPDATVDAAAPDVSTSPEASTAPDVATEPDAAHFADAAAVDAFSTDAGKPLESYSPPIVVFPTTAPATPFLLSQIGLYADMASKTLAPDLLPYEPAHALWSDGADKARHLRLPRGTTIDASDMDHWQFPVGTMLFKEFALGGKRLETRLVARIGPGERDYFFGAFVWRDDESDAELTWDGVSNVRATEHDVPSVTQCGTCHNGEPGRVLGFSAVQTPSQAAALLEPPSTTPYQTPGSAAQAQALGYLHANCGHCHNPNGSARPDTDLMLRLSVGQQTVESTSIYVSSVGKKLQSFMGADLEERIVAGQPVQSGLYFRMSQRGPKSQMPPIASELIDPQGLSLVAAFISSLTP